MENNLGSNIIFAHNSHNRPDTLIDTINSERIFFPNSKFYLGVTIDGTIKNLYLDYVDYEIIPTNGLGWQLGCVNCFYSCVSKICEEYDNGIIVFSHDDVILRNFEVLKEKLNLMIKDDLSYILRRPSGWGGKYFMMEVVLLNIKHIREKFTPHNTSLLENTNLITLDIHGRTSAESWLAEILFDVKNGLVIDYPHMEMANDEVIKNLIDNLGYEHIKS